MPKLLFFVDDDKMILNLLEYTIKNMQEFDVKTYHSGEECLDNLSLDPDLIILDYLFKDNEKASLNGIETLRSIREVNKDVPVVILSNAGDEKIKSEFEDLGVSGFIPKDDYFIDVLMETIQKEL